MMGEGRKKEGRAGACDRVAPSGPREEPRLRLAGPNSDDEKASNKQRRNDYNTRLTREMLRSLGRLLGREEVQSSSTALAEQLLYNSAALNMQQS